MRKAIAMDGGYSTFWMRCVKSHCRTFINTYIPLPPQYEMHRDNARYLIAAGGYGSGKTQFDNADTQKGSFLSPGGQTLFGAPVLPQLNATLKRDFEQDFPIEFVKRYSAKENKFTTINNHEFLYRSFDDPEKLRSLNLSRFVILEGSGTKYGTFTQLQNRLRNTAGTIPKLDAQGNFMFKYNKRTDEWVMELLADWRKGTVETNPDPGWVKSQGLESSGKVFFYENSYEKYRYVNVNPNLHTHIIPTKANYMLPPGYVEEQSYGKPFWWIKRYFQGSFAYSEGLVYPNASKILIKSFAIPKNWKRIIAMDYGISDNTHFLFGALDIVNKKVYIYDELVMNSSSVGAITLEYRGKLRNIPDGGLLTTPVMDQRSRDKRQSFNVKKTLGDLFEDEGVIFDPAQMDIDSRVLRTNGLIDFEQLFIFEDTCPNLSKEILEYRFPEKTLDKPNKDTNKPQDKFNHGVNALEFLCMELPYNLETYDFTLYNRGGRPISATKQPTEIKLRRGYDPLSDSTIIDNDRSYFPLGGDVIDDYYNSDDFDMPYNLAEHTSFDEEPDLD